MKKLLYVFIVFVLAFIFSDLYVSWGLSQRKAVKSITSCDKIWSARGIYKVKTEQNSIGGFLRAQKDGFTGAEVDVHYDVKTNQYIASHDHPTLSKDGELLYELKNGEILNLEDLLLNINGDFKFWLDFKKLRKLNKDQVEKAIQRLEDITAHSGWKKRIVIEGADPINLSRYASRGFTSMLDTHPLPESVLGSSVLMRFYRMLYYYGDFDVMAMKYGKGNPVYGESTAELLKNIPIFLYHIPVETKVLNRLIALPNVHVMLIGKDQSIHISKIDSCQI